MLSSHRLSCLLSAIVAAGIFGFFFIRYPFYPEDLFLKDPLPQTADAVVILEGAPSEERIRHGVRTAFTYAVPLIYYPGIHPSNEALFQSYLDKYGGDIRVILEGGTESTEEEAYRCRDFAREYSIDCIFLVTSPYHSYRADWIFEKIIDGVEIISTPVPKNESWFDFDVTDRESLSAETFFSEQIKFALTWFLYFWR